MTSRYGVRNITVLRTSSPGKVEPLCDIDCGGCGHYVEGCRSSDRVSFALRLCSVVSYSTETGSGGFAA